MCSSSESLSHEAGVVMPWQSEEIPATSRSGNEITYGPICKDFQLVRTSTNQHFYLSKCFINKDLNPIQILVIESIVFCSVITLVVRRWNFFCEYLVKGTGLS